MDKPKRLRRTKLQMELDRNSEHALTLPKHSLKALKKENEGGSEGNEPIASERAGYLIKWINIQKYPMDNQGRPSLKYFRYSVGGDLWDSKEEATKNKSQFTWDTVRVEYKNPILV
jgi:hypothetical protein